MTTPAPVTEPKTPAPGTGHVGQTFLVGNEIYLRAIELADAARGQSLATSIYPRSATRIETWIKDDLAKGNRTALYPILRKSDDVVVGSLKTDRYDPKTFVTIEIDPLYGDRGQAWKAEAIGLVIPWLGNEQHRPILEFKVPANESTSIAALEAAGGRECARYREQLQTWGGRQDAVVFEYFNPLWEERLGDPFAIEPARSGTGEARPVPSPVTIEGDPPANAMKIGQRVYLRPLTKDDAAIFAKLSRQDPETFWDAGRWMHSTPGFQNWIATSQKGDPVSHTSFAVCLRESDELIGTVAIHDIDYLNGTAESASRMYRPEYRGGGYGSEAKHLLFDYAFNDLNLHSLWSTVIYPNSRSAAALLKQGYREVGALHWDFFSHGSFENFRTFDLLASDWRAMPRATYGAEGERSS